MVAYLILVDVALLTGHLSPSTRIPREARLQAVISFFYRVNHATHPHGYARLGTFRGGGRTRLSRRPAVGA
jgi:hypothetical protein